MPKSTEFSVFFRIVGIYFGSTGTGGPIEVKFDKKMEGRLKVSEVMEAVRRKVAAGGVPNVTAFNYMPLNPSPSENLGSVTVIYDTDPVTGATGDRYAYTLRDRIIGTESSELQYYVFDTKMKQLNNNNNTKFFGQLPDSGAEIENGHLVVWRQLTVLYGPNSGQLEITRATRGMQIMESA